MTPLVSVIVPTFNRAQFVPPAIASVLSQTLTAWELIVADDGSDAPTRSYLETLHAPPRVRVIWLPHSGKPAVARNAALRSARGDYVAFLDSDDLWLPEKLERQVASLQRQPQRGWGYTGFTVVDASGQPRAPDGTRVRPVMSGWITQSMLSDATVIALPTVIVARALLEQLGAFDEDLLMCEDDDLWLRLSMQSEVDGIDEPLTLVRRHGEHGGDDVTAWRDRRRVFEKALRGSADPQLRAILRRLRAEMSAGLARSQASAALRTSALATLANSAPYAWRYPRWWAAAARTLAHACTPEVLRAVIRRHGGARRQGAP